jgi:CHAT domain-containing protein
LSFGNYTLAGSDYVFTQNDAVVTATGVADSSHFLLTRDSLYTASSSSVLAPGSVRFDGSIQPFSATTLNGFLVARQAYIGLQSAGSGFTSPFGDYATTDLTNTPAVPGNAGFSVIIQVDPAIGAYQAPAPPPAPSGDSNNNGNNNNFSGDAPSKEGPTLNGASLVVTLPISQSAAESTDSGKPRPPQRGNGSGAGARTQAGNGPGSEIAISASSAGLETAASGSGPALTASGVAAAGANLSANGSWAPQATTTTASDSIDRFNADELAITRDTAKALGVGDAEALTPAQLQKRLQAATVSMRKRPLPARGTSLTRRPETWSDQGSWLAVQPLTTVSDAGGLGGPFAGAKGSGLPIAGQQVSAATYRSENYNPAILSIRYSEAKGRTADPKADAFLDYTLIPAQGPIIGHRLELNSSRFAALLRQLYGSLSRQESLDVADRNSASRQLHGLLIGPVAQQLQDQSITTLLIAADRGLQGVPFAALHDGQQFFGDRYAFSLSPALSLTDLKLQDETANRLLTFGASQFQDGLAPLPLVPQELAKIASLKAGEAMLDRSFTPRSLLGAAGDPRYGWIHVATHAEFLPGGPSQSRLFTGTDPLPLSAFADLRKTRQDHPIHLFSLSACRTALGDSESELGFAGLAIQAGARSAIGTLWYVDDVATSAYFVQVYRYLKQGLPKAEALQATRRDFNRGRVQLVGTKIVAADGELLLDHLSVPQQRRVASGLANPYSWAGIEMVGAPGESHPLPDQD